MVAKRFYLDETERVKACPRRYLEHCKLDQLVVVEELHLFGHSVGHVIDSRHLVESDLSLA